MSNENELLSEICYKSLLKNGLDSNDKKKRINEELREIADKKEAGYFVDLYKRKIKFAKNDHNLAVAYLLDLAPDVVWEKGPGYTVPEWP